MRPVKKKTYQDHTFALHIPLELDDDDLDSLKLEHLSWLCLLAHAWWRHLQMLPHTPLWERLAKLRLHVSIASFKQMISSRWIMLNLHFIFSWYIWWLGDKHESSLNLLLQATLAICSTLHLTILHINLRREHWSSCSLLEFNTWTQYFPMDKIYKSISM